MKTKRQKFIVMLLMLSMIAMYGLIPATSEAVSFSEVKDLISSSNVSQANVTHTISATTTLPISAGGYFEVIFPAAFTNVLVGGVTCPAGGTAAVVGNTVTCTYVGAQSAGAYEILVTGVTNPGVIGSQLFQMRTRDSGNVEIEHSTFRVAIVNSVSVTATVEASLTFTITGIASTSNPVVNGAIVTASSTSRNMAFGVLAPGVEKTMAQRLNVTTNAAYGYTVTVAQNHNLLSSNGADIDSFRDGVEASTTALAWASPTGTLGQEMTYGHFGFTSQDSTIAGSDPYGTAMYKGFNNSDPIAVMYHNSVADGIADDIGSTSVAYSIEITPLQEAGDYSNTLTYVCTPTY